MDVAAVSVLMKQEKLIQQVGVSVMKKAMSSDEINVEALIQMMEQSVQPYLGQSIDIKL
ncbi:MAG TPA: putative motility protein [Clostridiaceae bacterium]|nr:putative motility protein [Clostridiaceae bacterium]